MSRDCKKYISFFYILLYFFAFTLFSCILNHIFTYFRNLDMSVYHFSLFQQVNDVVPSIYHLYMKIKSCCKQSTIIIPFWNSQNVKGKLIFLQFQVNITCDFALHHNFFWYKSQSMLTYNSYIYIKFEQNHPYMYFCMVYLKFCKFIYKLYLFISFWRDTWQMHPLQNIEFATRYF